MKKVALHTLGCKVNTYETDAMEQMLVAHGYEIVPFDKGADIYIINTCSVTNMADRKSRQMLHKAKKMNPNAVVVAAGCYVQAAPEEVMADVGVDLVVGNNKKKDLIQILENYFVEHEMENVIDIAHTNEYESLTITKLSNHTRAYIKVQDGCNQFCSYCIIPYTRGRVRSREFLDIKTEVETLVAQGTKEFVLTGIHLSSYGVDFKDKEYGLLQLILDLSNINGVERIRLGSLEPRIVTEEFVKTLSQLDKFCPHFHLSLQSGCNETLRRMNRHYTAEEYYEKCELLRKYFVMPAITTDVIVGFPEETEEEFKITKEFLAKVQFYEMHIFKYSKRKGTRAAEMPNQVDESIKTKRSNELLALEKQMSEKYRTYFIGKEVSVLTEEKAIINGKEYMVGHTKEYVKVAIDMDLIHGMDKENLIVTGILGENLEENVYLLKEIQKDS